MTCILVTGGAGFIGSHLVDRLMAAENVKIVVLDALTYAGSRENLAEHFDKSKFEFVEGDIGDGDLTMSLFEKYDFDTVFHLAAESHVDNAIESPGVFVKTNVTGTYNLLHGARTAWEKTGYARKRFIHVSTDEVFGQLTMEDPPFSEATPYAPSSPYSASKAASDLLAKSWHHTYKFPVIVTNCSNNYGTRQHGEKLIPTVIRSALSGHPIPIYGTGMNIRDWLYVEDHCEGLIAAARKGISGESYCLGGDNEIANLDLAKAICEILDRLKLRDARKTYADQLTFVTDRKGHDFRYAIDFTKAKAALGWKPNTAFETGLEKTVAYYLGAYQPPV